MTHKTNRNENNSKYPSQLWDLNTVISDDQNIFSDHSNLDCSFWLTAPKSLGVFWAESDKDICCYVNDVPFEKPSGDLRRGGWLSREPTLWREAWNFYLAHQPALGGERGLRLSPVADGQWLNWWHLSNEVSIKAWKVSVQRAFRLVSMWSLWAVACLERSGKLQALSPHLALCVSPTWLFLSYVLL